MQWIVSPKLCPIFLQQLNKGNIAHELLPSKSQTISDIAWFCSDTVTYIFHLIVDTDPQEKKSCLDKIEEFN